MAMYNYSITTHVPAGTIRPDQLRDELNAVLTTNVANVASWTDNIRIVTSGDLTASEEPLVLDVLTSHSPATVVAQIPSVELVDGDGDTSIRLETNQATDEDVVIIKTDGVDRVTFGGVNYDSKVFKTKDTTGSDWMQHQIGTEGSAYTVMKRSLGTYENPLPLTDGIKAGGYAFALDDGNGGATPQYGAEIAAYALGDQSPTNGGAEIRISATRQNTKGRQQIMWLDADQVQLHAYPNSRDDGSTSTVLYVDDVGILQHGTVDHNTLSNYISAEHVDHSTITIDTGDGLIGGGAIDGSMTLSVVTGKSITINTNAVELVNDSDSPGTNKVYGTNSLGVKGWKNDPTLNGGGSSDFQQAWVSLGTVPTTGAWLIATVPNAPANAIATIIIENSGNASSLGGVRAIGTTESRLSRVGGKSALTMPVKLNALGQFECYANSKAYEFFYAGAIV